MATAHLISSVQKRIHNTTKLQELLQKLLVSNIILLNSCNNNENTNPFSFLQVKLEIATPTIPTTEIKILTLLYRQQRTADETLLKMFKK